MSISYLSALPRYTTPDIKVIHTTRTELERKLSLGETLYLQPLAVGLTALKKQIHAVEDYVLELLTAVPVSLRTQTISELLGEMQAAAGLASAPSTSAKVARYQNELKELIDYRLNILNNRAGTLSILLDNLTEWTMEDAAHFISEHETQRARQQEILDRLTARRVELQADKQKINDAMRVYEELTVLDRWTPILKDLLKVKPSSANLMVLQAGVVGVKNILQIAAEAVRYEDLVDAQARAHELLIQQQEQITQYRTQLSTLNARTRELRNIEGVEALKQRYEQEVRKVADALNTFLTLRQRSDEPVDELARVFVTQANALSSWLLDLKRNWK
ncbi:alpha-xenorhabdolysin family binary toxin subunit B [Pseudomonas sp. JDS28PS106]|uniref:alpha-xenorhabdolysin family binary toxin subunit B n=1 Tax=Pseudomonas sp. JDS28PS106 TaxID=2497235 RepID=UPI002FD75A33